MSGAYVSVASAVAAAAGEGLNAYNQNQNMRKQDNQTAQSIIRQGDLTKQAGQQVKSLTDKIAGSNPDDAVKQQNAAYLSALQQANPTQSTVSPAVGGASKRYTQATDAAKSDVANYGRSTASALAKTAAPQLQRIGEGNEIANTASNLGLISDASGAESGLLKTRLAGDSTNPWLGALSQVLQGAGQGGSMYAGYRMGGMGATKKAPGYSDTPTGMGGSNPYLA